MDRRMRIMGAILACLFLVVPVAAQVDYPQELKSIVAPYPGAELEMATKTQQGTHVVMTTSDPAEKVYGYYKEALMKAGWSTEMEMSHKEGLQGHWKKNDKMLHVVVGKDSEKTQIVLLLMTGT